MVVLHAIVKGRVQGVGFRFFTERKAGALKLTGWVKNLYSGEVEVSACGSDSAISAFIEHLRKGPFMSHVTDVDYTLEDTGTNPYDSFDVRF